MSAIIKSAEAARYAPLQSVMGAPASAVAMTAAEPLIDEKAARIALLEDQIEEARREIGTLRADAEKAFARGEAQGIGKGRREAERREEERVSLVTAMARKAQLNFDEALGRNGQLAALMARACLDKLFGDATGNDTRVESLLKTQLEQLAGIGKIEIAVSPHDFDDTDLDAMRVRLGPQTLTLRLDPELPSGGCRLRPRLGEIDIGLATQWAAVRKLLDSLVLQEDAPC